MEGGNETNPTTITTNNPPPRSINNEANKATNDENTSFESNNNQGLQNEEANDNVPNNPTVNGHIIEHAIGGSTNNFKHGGNHIIIDDDEEEEEKYNGILEDDDDDDDDDDEMDNDNTITYISVYSGEAIEKPSPVRKKKKANNGKILSSSPKAKVETPNANNNGDGGFFALRNGRTTSHCIYLKVNDLNEQVREYPLAEYKQFKNIKKAVEYIQNDPLFIMKTFKKRKVYEIQDDNEEGTNKNYTNSSDAITSPAKKVKTDKEESWEGMYVQLIHFHRKHGCTDIPTISTYKHLYAWAKTQRKEFLNFANGQESTMTEAKVQLLLGLNFDFGAKASSRTFDDYCQEVVNYRARNDGKDPIPGTQLCSWITRMKKKYETFTKGTAGDKNNENANGKKQTSVYGMDKEKALTLELIGFSWTKEPSEECKKKWKDFRSNPMHHSVPITDKQHSSAIMAASSTGANAMAYASANAATVIETARTTMLKQTEKAIQQQIENQTQQQNEQLSFSNAQHFLPILPKGAEQAVEEEQKLQHYNQMQEQLQLQQKQIQLQKLQTQQLQRQLAHQHANFGTATTPLYGIHPTTQADQNGTQTRQSSLQPNLYVVPETNNANQYQPIAPRPYVYFTKQRPSKSVGIKEVLWNERFADLKKFKEEKGHLNVENNDEDLAKWCLIQRRNFKQYKKGTKTFLTEDKIAKLKYLGFDFEPISFLGKTAQNFYKRCEELKKFKEEHGHCEVPTYTKLYAYLLDQKAKYRKYEEEKKKEGFQRNEWTETKIAKLKEIGFDFVHGRKSDKRMTDNKRGKQQTEEEKTEAQEKWMEMFEEIKSYKKQHGKCVPPSKPYTPLRAWVEKQRNGYKKFLAGRPTELTGLRIRYLNEIQFPFTPTRIKVPWEERFLELKSFKEKYGNCLVPRGYPGRLGNWVQNQRNKYKITKGLNVKGKQTGLTQDQIKRLEDLGMVWSILPTPVVLERKSWNERFQDLLQYKEEHGHTRVPQSYPRLGNWVHAQRVGYQLMKKGDYSRLNTEKALKLAEIGFEFVIAPNKQRSRRINLFDPIPHLARRANDAAANDDDEEESNDEDEEESSEEEENDETQEEERGVRVTGATYM